MFTLDLTMIENNFDELERRIKELSKSESETGYFIEQGKHKGTQEGGKEAMFYTDLIGYHASGWPSGGIPSRPVIEIAYLKFSPQTQTMKRDLTKYFSDIKNKSNKITTEKIHEHFIQDLSIEIKSVFGDTNLLESNQPSTIKRKKVSKKDSPMVDTHELRDALSYSIDGSAPQLTKNLG